MQISNQEYHADNSRISNSRLKELAKSPRHYWAKYLDPNRQPEPQTDALLLGQACHTAVFEPHKFDKEFAVKPKFDMRTTAGKQAAADFQEMNNGKTLITIDMYDNAMRIKSAVRNHDVAKLFLQKGKAEETFYFTEPESGAPVKIRTDFISESTNYIVDLKTTKDASPLAFGKSAYDYWYHTQAALYLDGLSFNNVRPDGFLFIAVESSAPYEVALYYADDEAIQLGRQTYMPLLKLFQECQQSGNWPGYSSEVQQLQLPNWALNKLKF
jgi:exodeoxyribonuclease VIII